MGFNAVVNFGAGDHYYRVVNKARNATKKFSKSVRASAKNAKEASKSYKALGSSIAGAGAKVSMLGAGILAFGILALKKSGEIEQIGVAFETMTGSAKAGQKALKSVIAFTASTPFQLEGVSGVATGLLSVGFKADELTARLKTLGDIAAGVNKSIAEVAQPFLKGKSSKFSMEVMTQFLEKNINLWPAMTKTMGKTKDQVIKLFAKGKMTFAHLDAALQSMTKKGGLFHDMMKKMSNTFPGLISTLSDNITMAMAVIGDAIRETTGIDLTIVSMTKHLKEFQEWFPAWAKAHPGIMKTAIALGGVLIVLGPLMIVLGGLLTMIATMKIALAVLGVSFTFGFWPITIAVGAVLALIVAGKLMVKYWSTVGPFLEGILSGIVNKFAQIKDLIVGGFEFLGLSDTTHKLVGSIDNAMIENKSEVKIVIEAEPGVIREVEARTEGNTVIDTGNYSTAYGN